MRRRVTVGRRGPGLLGTMARTAVVAGTATVVAKGVSGSMDQKAAQQQHQAAFDAGVQHAQAQQQQQAQQAQQASPPQAASPGALTDSMIAQLQQLAELQKQGILTPEEFAQQKARILGGAG